MNQKRYTCRLLLLVIIACGFATSMLSAATTSYKWSGAGADNNWSTIANWTGRVLPPNGNDTIIQPQGTTKLAVTIDTSVSVNAIQFQGNSGAFVFSGSPITISGSTNAIHTSANTQAFQNDVIFTNTANVVAAGGNFVFNNITIDAGNITLQPAAGKLITINGTVAGTSDKLGRLDISSAGTVHLAGTATVAATTGGIRVYAGSSVLVIDGTVAAGTGNIEMREGSTLAGKGTINRAVTFSDRAILSPGTIDISSGGGGSGASSAGVLTIAGNLTFATGSLLKFDLGDSVSVTGNVVINSGAELILSGFVAPGDYQLFSVAGGSITDNGLTVTGLPADYTYTFANGLLKVALAPVPEPAATALLTGAGATLALIAATRRRRGH